MIIARVAARLRGVGLQLVIDQPPAATALIDPPILGHRAQGILAHHQPHLLNVGQQLDFGLRVGASKVVANRLNVGALPGILLPLRLGDLQRALIQ